MISPTPLRPSPLRAYFLNAAPLESLLSAKRASTGRPAMDRAALASAFIAKAVLNLPTTRHLIPPSASMRPSGGFAGWDSADGLPHESKFFRAFAEFAGHEPRCTGHSEVGRKRRSGPRTHR